MQPSSTNSSTDGIMPANEAAEVNRAEVERVAGIGDENRAVIESTDPLAPPGGYGSVYVVGLGGSAGGIAALQKFFEQVPAQSDMAYVVILHLSPEHESQLAAILQQSTLMPVLQVTERVLVEANHVYVIPPGHHLMMDNGHISLAPPQQKPGQQKPGQRVAVDLFFRTLAQTHGPRAVQQSSDIKVLSVPFQMGDTITLIDLHIRPLLSPAATQPFLLVIFDEKDQNAPALSTTLVHADVEPVEQRLEEEVEYLKRHLNATVEQYETSTEELKASNEELQAINEELRSATEELRSATEELETGKEELQSINKELITVNSELKSKVEEVSRAHSDVQNLMVATDIATIFLDRTLCIKRYTPRAVDLFQLLPADIGRPLSDLRHAFEHENLAKDAQQVLDHLSVTERQMQARDGRWFLSRMLPYRSSEDRIEGVVLTFVYVTTRKQTGEALHQSEESFRSLVEGVQDYAIFMLDLEGRHTTWNIGVERLLGYREDEFIGRDAAIIFTPEDRASGQPAKEQEEALVNGRAIDEHWHLRQDGSRFWASGVLTALRDEQGELQGYSKIMRDMTESKQIADELQTAHDELETRVAQRTEELLRLTVSLQTEINERRAAVAQTEQSEQRRGELLKHIVTAQEDERRRISRELHDQMGQQLSALMIGLKSLPDLPNTAISSPSVNTRIEDLQNMTTALMEQMHNLARELRPAVLDNFGLQAALTQFVQDWSNTNGIAADFMSPGLPDTERLSLPLETTLYRVVQEALLNVQRHAQATAVSVLLERQENNIVAIVEDNGRGFGPESENSSGTENKAPSRLGLLGMEERLELVGGHLTIESTPGSGTTIYASVPLERRQSPRD